MSPYFAYSNPPISRDTQADIDRIPDHFARIVRQAEDDYHGRVAPVPPPAPPKVPKTAQDDSEPDDFDWDGYSDTIAGML